MDECDVWPMNLDTTVPQDNVIENYDPQEIWLEVFSVVDRNKLSQLQQHDPTLKTCRDKDASLTKNEPKALYWGK